MVSKLLYQLMDWETFSRRHAVFREYSLSVPPTLQCSGIQGTFREYFKESFFKKKFFDEKFVFVLKVHDLKKTNVDLLPNSSNDKAMLPDNSTKICFKNILRISPEYCNAMEIFL